VFLLFPSFAVFCVAMVGEVNRAPFDLPEAESELVGGFHTEYSSLKFALFFLAEYVNMVTVSAMATTLFLGGWHAPWPLAGGPLDSGWWGPVWFIGKTLAFLFVFVWLRGTLPRLRYDQFMQLGWKVLVPGSLIWIVVVSGVRALRGADVTGSEILVVGGILLGALVLVAFLLPERRTAAPSTVALSSTQRSAAQRGDEVPTAGSNYPLPPLDLVVPAPPPRRAAVTSSEVTSGAPPTTQEDGHGTA
jgi:NADH-quinone oxidoreductase subunit H